MTDPDTFRRGLAFALAAAARNLAAIAVPRVAPPTGQIAADLVGALALDGAPAPLETPPNRWSLADARAAARKADQAARDAYDRASAAHSAVSEMRARGGSSTFMTALDAALAVIAIQCEGCRAAAGDARDAAQSSLAAATASEAWTRADAAQAAAARAAGAAEVASTSASGIRAVRRDAVIATGLPEIRSTIAAARQRVEDAASVFGDDIDEAAARVKCDLERRSLDAALACFPAGGGPPIDATAGPYRPAHQSPAVAVLASADGALVQRRPTLAYSLACHLVRWDNARFDDPVVRGLFDTALASDAQARFIPMDPELTTARDREGFARLALRAAAVVREREAAAAAAAVAVAAAPDSGGSTTAASGAGAG